MDPRIVAEALRHLAHTVELTESNPKLLKGIIAALGEARECMIMKAYQHQMALIRRAKHDLSPEEMALVKDEALAEPSF